MTIAGAVILAVIAGTLHWKRRVPRFVAWVLLLVGIGGASVITGWFGGFTSISIYGVGLFSIAAVFGAIVFWEEAVKRNGLHRVRTPIIAVVFGVALMSAGGAGWAALQQVVRTGSVNVDQAVTTSFNK